MHKESSEKFGRKMNNWRDIDVELPPKDGMYAISSGNFDNPFDVGIVEYDGFGFLFNGIYRKAKYWKYIEIAEKRYGPKLKNHNEFSVNIAHFCNKCSHIVTEEQQKELLDALAYTADYYCLCLQKFVCKYCK